MIVGIDNGITGALVALSRIAGCSPVAMVTMPSRDGEIDTLALVRWLERLEHGGDGLLIAVEDCPHHARDKAAMRSMALNFGKIVGGLEADGRWTVQRVKSGNNKAGWQRGMLGIVPQGKTKEYALAAAQSIWLDETWLATARCKKPHAGLVDAALIAEFTRRQLP